MMSAHTRPHRSAPPRRAQRWALAALLGLLSAPISLRCSLAQQVDISIVDDRSVHVPYEYEVEEGDTLWLISQEFFNDPLLWPNLWALNPSISNPHWIYPGDIIRLKWNPQAVRDSGDDNFELEPVTYSTDIQKVARRARNMGLILDKELEPIAQIVASPEPREGLATGDRVYLKVPQLDQIQLGQSLSVYRSLSLISHPHTGEEVGRKVALIATLEVVERGGDQQLVKAVITQAQREVTRGDIVVPMSDSMVDVSPVKNFVDLEGVILDDLEGYSELGQHHLVFIDKGSEDGVQVGNRLSIARRGDGVRALDSDELKALPLEPVGEVLIIALQPHSSTALITRSILELKKGDQVFMLRNY